MLSVSLDVINTLEILLFAFYTYHIFYGDYKNRHF